LSDYTHYKYEEEICLLLQLLDAGVLKAINTAENIEICKKQQIKILKEEHPLAEKTATDVVNTLILILRGNTNMTEVQKDEELLAKTKQDLIWHRERIAKYQKRISVGQFHTIGLKATGTVVAVG